MNKRIFAVLTLCAALFLVLLFAAVELFAWFNAATQLTSSSKMNLVLILVTLITSLSGVMFLVYWLISQLANKRWLNLIRQINKDDLTGLPNQQRLLRDLEQASHTNLALLKLNNYNNILNAYGPAVTDDLIRQVAIILAQFEHPMLQKAN